MMSAFTDSFNSFWGTARTVPMVPTGMKMGVWIAPWSVSRTPARALEPGSWVSRVNFNASVLTTALCPRQSVEPQR